jgi:hypothetical protein
MTDKFYIPVPKSADLVKGFAGTVNGKRATIFRDGNTHLSWAYEIENLDWKVCSGRIEAVKTIGDFVKDFVKVDTDIAEALKHKEPGILYICGSEQ